jgi:steroid delta-isomerase
VSALAQYADFFAGLTPADLDRLDTVFVENARFEDPFNAVTGLAGIRAVFEHMFANCAEARFEVLNAWTMPRRRWAISSGGFISG